MTFRVPWAATYRVRCPDGEKTVYRRIEDAFPLQLTEFGAGLAATIKDLTGTDIQLRAEYATHIQGLLYSLSELNETIMLSFRAAYTAFKNDPCNNSGFFTRKVDELTAEVQELAGVRLRVRALVQLAATHPDDSAQVWTVFQEIVARVGGREIPRAAAAELEQARNDAEQWIRGEDPNT